MSAETTITGNLGRDPELKYMPDGTPVLNFSVGCTPRVQNRQTQQWEDDEDPLWIDVAIWGGQAERLVELLFQGCQVSVRGVLKRRNWIGNDGQQGTSLSLKSVKFLGYLPKRDGGNGLQASQDQFSGGYSHQTPTYPPNARNASQNGVRDGWGQPGPDPAGNLAQPGIWDNQEPPF